MKIVVYIRAVFECVEKAGLEKKNFIKAAAKFTELASISFLDYRKILHNIQQKNLACVADKIIVNKMGDSVDGVAPFFKCLPPAIGEFLTLDDSDIVIPLDDDDWLSPELRKVEFNKEGITCWNSYILSKGGFSEALKNYNLPNLLNPEELQQSKTLTSSGYAIAAKEIKQVVNNPTKFEHLNILLQRHSRAREMSRILGITEKIIDNKLSVYLKHAANMTLVHELDGEEALAADAFKRKIQPYRDVNYFKLHLPENLAWCAEHLRELSELNAKI